MKPAPALLACLLFSFSALALSGCMETLELAGELADDGSDEATAEDECTPAPASCRKTRPHEAALRVSLSTPLPEIVTIYRGDFEEGRVAWSGPPQGKHFSVKLPLGTYSATAAYARGAKTIVAVDGDYLDYTEDETCDGSCYDVVDGAVDLELED